MAFPTLGRPVRQPPRVGARDAHDLARAMAVDALASLPQRATTDVARARAGDESQVVAGGDHVAVVVLGLADRALLLTGLEAHGVDLGGSGRRFPGEALALRWERVL